MECVYCLSPVDEKANVCKVCTRDLYLFRPLLEKVKELEDKLAEHQDPVELMTRVEELEAELAAERAQAESKLPAPWRAFADIGQFLVIPLALLLLAHALVTVVYDINMLYLRIVSIVLPLPFGIYLFKTRQRSILVWFLGKHYLQLFGRHADGRDVLPPQATCAYQEGCSIFDCIGGGFHQG